jgi:hypothetical protein
MFTEVIGSKHGDKKGAAKLTKYRTNPMSGWVDVYCQTEKRGVT